MCQTHLWTPPSDTVSGKGDVHAGTLVVTFPGCQIARVMRLAFNDIHSGQSNLPASKPQLCQPAPGSRTSFPPSG